MEASLLIRLIDGLTGPAAKIKKSLKSIGDTASEMGKGFAEGVKDSLSVENIEKATKQAEQAFTKARQRLIGAAGMALSLGAPIRELGNFEERLVDFGNTAGIFDDDLLEIGDELRRLGPEVNKTANEMLDAYEYLVGKGMDPKTALDALRSVGMTSTGTKANITDMAAAGFAAMDNLKVGAEDLQLAFDAMAQSGKSGGFELKGMATYFPSLTASAQALGMKGVSAVSELGAALQIAMKGTGDESTAANNLQNFLSKLSSREVTANFKKNFGVDLEAEFQKASDSGVSVFEHMVGLINELTNGNQFEVQKLFGDQQVLAFLKPMLANLDEYREIRDASLNADGVNEADFGRVMDTFNSRWKGMMIGLDNLVAKSGALLDIAKDVATQIGAVVDQINAFAEAHPELTRNLVLGTAALLAMSIAMRLLAFATAGARLGAINLIASFLKFDESGKNVATGWRMLASAGSFLSGAFSLITASAGGIITALAGISAPVWGLVALFVLAAAAIGIAVFKYWEPISNFFIGFGQVVAEAIGTAMAAIGGFAVDRIIDVGKMFGIEPAEMQAAIDQAKADIQAAWDGMVAWLRELPGKVGNWMGDLFKMEDFSDEEEARFQDAGRRAGEAVVKAAQSALGAAKAVFGMVFDITRGNIDPLVDWLHSVVDGIVGFALNIDWPEAPDWLKWLIGAGADLLGGGKEATEKAANSLGIGKPPPPDDGFNPFGFLGFGGPPPPEVETTIAAEVVDKRPPSVTNNNTFNIDGSAGPEETGRAVAAALNSQIGQARTGALHDGME